MVISKSGERPQPCTGSAAVYSGRRDPEWEVPDEAARRLRELWDSLEPTPRAPPAAPALGYRGCTLTCPVHGRWFAFSGVVSMGKEHRSDVNRSFERALLQTAPKGSLPGSVFDQLK